MRCRGLQPDAVVIIANMSAFLVKMIEEAMKLPGRRAAILGTAHWSARKRLHRVDPR